MVISSTLASGGFPNNRLACFTEWWSMAPETGTPRSRYPNRPRSWIQTKKPDFKTLSIQFLFFRFVNANLRLYFVQFVLGPFDPLEPDLVPHLHKTGFLGQGIEKGNRAIADNVPAPRRFLWI